MKSDPISLKQKVSLYSMSVLYIAAGVYHFVAPQFYVAIMPPYIPFHNAFIYISGIAEIVLGILLLFNNTRKAAAYGIVMLLLIVFPANVQMLINYMQQHNPNIWIAVVRLHLQAPLIWWAWKQKDLIM